MRLHAFTHTPDFANSGVAEGSVAVELITKIDHAPGFINKTFGRVVCQLRQGFRTSDSNPYWNARAFMYSSTNGATVGLHISRHASQIGERFVHLKERCQPMDMSETRADSSFPAEYTMSMAIHL